MAEIRPFRGVRYNRELAGGLADIICPPYDVITPQLQQELYHRSPYNVVRIEAGRELAQDTNTDNKYTRSAATLEQWLAEGILAADPAPAVYIHDHYFSYEGKDFRRRSIIAGVRLEEWDKKVVRPHEGILAEHKGDRFSLLWALQANTSPILALFEDRGQQVATLLAKAGESQPLVNFSESSGERHELRAITRPDIISQLAGCFADSPLYIADGHHRYESALAFQREKRAGPASMGDKAYDFVMMALVDFADPGVLILPPHRLVGGIPRAALSQLSTKLKSLFNIEELPLDAPDVWGKVDQLLAAGGKDEVRFALFGLAEDRLLILKLRDFAAASRMMPYFHSELYKKLDVSVLDHVILEELLGLGSGGEGAVLAFSYEGRDAVNRVLEQEYQLAFLLRPIKLEVIKAVADADDRMPRKSTYFYPKAPAGLVLHRLV
ncbi:hypothetical protein ES708_13611 [subsurface metagenome]